MSKQPRIASAIPGQRANFGTVLAHLPETAQEVRGPVCRVLVQRRGGCVHQGDDPHPQRPRHGLRLLTPSAV